jgi:hypothetical protein
MKKIWILLVFVFSTTLSFAQDQNQASNLKKNVWRREYGSAFDGNGDLRGYTVYNEYARLLSNKFRVGVSFGFMNFPEKYLDESLHRSGSARSIEVTGYYTPKIWRMIQLEAGAGVAYRNWRWMYVTGPFSTFHSEALTLKESSIGQVLENSIGCTLSLGLIININDYLAANLRTGGQIGIDSNSASMSRIGLNIRF